METKQKEPSKSFSLFLKGFSEKNEPEEQLGFAISSIESLLTLKDSFDFKTFLEIKQLALPLFKKIQNSNLRSLLWTKCTRLSEEAYRLKDQASEQASFAAEQILLAIEAISNELSQLKEEVVSPPVLKPDDFPKTLEKDFSFYQEIQSKLFLLNGYASKITSLRKELLRIDMKISLKNKLFQNLSKVGDLVFPKRKTLILTISDKFASDVTLFLNSIHSDASYKNGSFFLREEIKRLQGIGKLLTLNTPTFNDTRTCLSKLWDKLKEEDKERKKERLEQKLIFKANFDAFSSRINAVAQKFEALSKEEIEKEIRRISTDMRQKELGREEVRLLKEELTKLSKQLEEKIILKQQTELDSLKQQASKKKEKALFFEMQAKHLVETAKMLSLEELERKNQDLLKAMKDSSLSKIEKQEAESFLKPLRTLISEKKEEEFFNLSGSEQTTIEKLQETLNKHLRVRSDIKSHLETLKKNAASSSLDFQKAMALNLEIEEEKARLEKANRLIEELHIRLPL